MAADTNPRVPTLELSEQFCINNLVIELAAIVHGIADDPAKLRINKWLNQAEVAFWRQQAIRKGVS